jgi:NAD(P)-dependent dehydrogenase (short-subunit alcohol dehydrogenase family)
MSDPRRVLVAGAAGPLGGEVVAQLVGRGDQVFGSDLSQEGLDQVAAAVSGAPGQFVGSVVDLLNPHAVTEWVNDATGVNVEGVPYLDGLLHLVGGWRGGKSFSDNSPQDLTWLLSGLVRTLAHTTLAAYPALLAAPAPRVVIVSAHAVANPTAGNAAYVAAKAAAETWVKAMAEGFAGAEHQDAAALILSIKALLTDAMKQAQPERRFPGFTHAHKLASELIQLWDLPGAHINGTIRKLGG